MPELAAAHLHHHGHELVVVDVAVAVAVHLRQDRLHVHAALRALELRRVYRAPVSMVSTNPRWAENTTAGLTTTMAWAGTMAQRV